MLIEVPIRSRDANNIFGSEAERSECEIQSGQETYTYAKDIEKCRKWHSKSSN
jgi:hypothetical protein